MSASVPAGSLRVRLALQAPTDTPDDTGAYVRSWSQVASVWGRVASRDGRQQFEADTIEVAVTHLVTVRARPNVANGMRFVMRGRLLMIRAITDPDSRGRYLLCRCEEFAP